MKTKLTDDIKHSPPAQGAVGKKKGGRPKASPEKLKKKRGLRLSDEVYDRVKSLSELGKKSPSSVISSLIKESVVKQAPNISDMKCWSDLSRVTANLNQIAYRLNYLSRGGKNEKAITDKELHDCIEDVKKEVVALRAEIRDSISDR